MAIFVSRKAFRPSRAELPLALRDVAARVLEAVQNVREWKRVG